MRVGLFDYSKGGNMKRTLETYEDLNKTELMYRYIDENESVYDDYWNWVREQYRNDNEPHYLDMPKEVC